MYIIDYQYNKIYLNPEYMTKNQKLRPCFTNNKKKGTVQITVPKD